MVNPPKHLSDPPKDHGSQPGHWAGPLRFLYNMFKWEFGEPPTKNGLKRFAAALVGTILGTEAASATWLSASQNWDSLFYMLNSVDSSARWKLSVLGLFGHLPAIALAWIVSA